MNLPIETSWIIFLVMPLCIILSGLFHAAHYMKDAWAFGRQRTCKTIGGGFLRLDL